MPTYLSFDPDAELNGRTVLGFITNINYEEIESILASHQLAHVDPTQWYKLQQVLDVLSDVSNAVNSMENFVAIGIEAGKIGIKYLPPDYTSGTLEHVLNDYNRMFYTSRHRGNAGTVEFQKVSESHLTLTSCIPYPDDIFYGVFYAYVQHFTPSPQRFILRYDDMAPRRDHGGNKTIYHIIFQ